jgi:putative toxin-antitoxin system antitoxin component (TIGR02293 family)
MQHTKVRAKRSKGIAGYLSLGEVYEKLPKYSDSSKVMSSLIRETELPSILLAELFEMTPKTFAKYKNQRSKLPERYSELALRLQDLYKLGIELFGSAKGFNDWLKKESYGLAFKIPIKMMKTVTGIELVYEELMRIAYGATA